MTELAVLQPDLTRWLADFERSRGRAPRLLHIGNIANNAYLSAKFLNRAGLECDVLCHEYYHVMSCPEWEDADYHGDIKNDLYPTWKGIDLRGFERPRWFAQGPTETCIDYLIARRKGQTEVADTIRARLVAERELACAAGRGEVPPPSTFSRMAAFGKKLIGKSWKLPVLIALRTSIGRQAYWAVPGGTFRRNVHRLCAQFAELFPDRPDRLEPADFWRFRQDFSRWARLFRHYDLVVGYSVDGVFPMLAGSIPYVAFEHGTIRNLPFESTPEGRRCALTYRLANAVFITNCDNNQAADKLGLSGYRFVPHPINEDKFATVDPAALRRQVRERLGADFVVFHPSRQHWDAKRDTSWDKGNDILIEGFARFVRDVNPKAGAVFVEWGQSLAQTRDLLARLGVAERVLWIPPQPTPRMNAYIQASDVLADQFCIGAFGSTMPRGLMLGTPNLIYLNEDAHRWCMPELPPVLNARTPDEVFSALKGLHEDPAHARRVADAARAWYDQYHSSRVVVRAYVETTRELVAPLGKES